jgi:hypothetical protein
MRALLPLSLFVPALLQSIASAETFPLSVDELHAKADAIVVATVAKIRTISEPSRIDRGFGNSDWGIYLTLSVESVEKGDVPGDELVARCFRTKFRRSLTESITSSGHQLIPGAGARVRAYLTKDDGAWIVVLPNGLTSVGGTNGRQDGVLQDATEVAQLWNQGREFTFLLPLEIWLAVFVVAISILVVILLRSRRRNWPNGVVKG